GRAPVLRGEDSGAGRRGGVCPPPPGGGGEPPLGAGGPTRGGGRRGGGVKRAEPYQITCARRDRSAEPHRPRAGAVGTPTEAGGGSRKAQAETWVTVRPKTWVTLRRRPKRSPDREGPAEDDRERKGRDDPLSSRHRLRIGRAFRLPGPG